MRPRAKQLGQSGAATNQLLHWNGSNWVPFTLDDTVAGTITVTQFFSTDETPPDAGTMDGIPVIDFAADEEVYFKVGVSDGWDGSSDMVIKAVAGMSTAEASKTVRIATEGVIAHPDGTTTTLTATNADLSPGSSADTQERFTLRTISNTDLSVGALVYLKVARRDAPSNEHGGDWRLEKATANVDVEASNVTREGIMSPGGINEMVLAYNSTTTVDIGTGRCRDDSDTDDILFQTTQTINLGTTGANGLDTGSQASDTMYYIWAIKNPTSKAVAGLASLSGTSPTMPSGYTLKRVIGAIRSDDSTEICDFEVLGKGRRRRLIYHVDRNDLTVLSGGTATSASGTDVDLSDYLPPVISREAEIHCYTSAATSRFAFDPNDLVTGVDFNARHLAWKAHGATTINIVTDSSALIEYRRIDGTASVNIEVLGYIFSL